MPRITGQVFDFQSAVASGVAEWVANLFAMDWPEGIVYQYVANKFITLSNEAIGLLLDFARQTQAGAELMGGNYGYTKPGLRDIPICPGCPSGQIETRLLVKLYDRQGNVITEGDVSDVSRSIPDRQDLQDAAWAWGQDVGRKFYAAVALGGVTWEVKTVQRGTFFGR